jgi:hypothetical protein
MNAEQQKGTIMEFVEQVERIFTAVHEANTHCIKCGTKLLPNEIATCRACAMGARQSQLDEMAR